MRQALAEAEQAMTIDEVPIGAVLVSNGRVIARAHNLCERLCDPTAHAEMQAITAATNHLGGKYLHDCTLYVTIEPCAMCAGALRWSKISEIVVGAGDEKAGYRVFNPNILHPKTIITFGVLEQEASSLMRSFFERKRER